MKELIRRFSIVFIGSTIILSLFLFLVVYIPMASELEKSLVGNFNQISYSKYSSFENAIQRCIEGAKGLSSRSMIRDALAGYRNGKMGIEELRAYTKPKYEDGAKVLEHIIRAERVSGGVSVSTYADPIAVDDFVWYTDADLTDKVTSKIVLNAGNVAVVVVSPIVADKIVLGHDCVVYDLSDQIEGLNADNMEITVICLDEYKHFKDDSQVLTENGFLTVRHGDSIVYLTKLTSDTFFASSELQGFLFKPVSELSTRILATWLAVFVGLISFVYFYIVRFAKRELNRLEFSRDKFQTMAYKDDLTGAYSRTFLDVWNNTLRAMSLKYSIVVIDIDNFKNINDVYGHLMGDAVLRKVVASIAEIIRQTDFLVRYGGDEFLILLSSGDSHEALSLMTRVNEKLEALKDYPFPVHISYGVSTLEHNDVFDEKLKVADMLMYQAKQIYKEKLMKNGLSPQ